MNSYLIRNTRVFDGSRLSGPSDFVIGKGGKETVIEGEGLVLSPGFLDVHTHADIDIALKDKTGFISQGVTGVIGGNCGISAGVDNGSPWQGIIGGYQAQTAAGTGFSDYLRWLDGQDTLIKYHPQIGYHSLIVEAADKGIAPEKLLAGALSAGAIGMSVGFEYGHGKKLKGADQLSSLARVLSENGKVLSVHLRDQGKGLYDSVNEMIGLASAAGKAFKLQISHLKHKYMEDPSGDTVKRTLSIIERAIGKGVDVMVDAYPYWSSCTILDEKYIRQCPDGWNGVFAKGSPKSIGETALERSVRPEVVYREIKTSDPKAMAVYKDIMRESDVWEIISKEYCMIGSDALEGHPRGYGSFTRYLRHMLDSGWALEKALTKITSVPARYFGLDGTVSSHVLFDPATVIDKASYEEPQGRSEGIRAVFVADRQVYAP